MLRQCYKIGFLGNFPNNTVTLQFNQNTSGWSYFFCIITKGTIEKERVKNFWKLRTHTKFSRPTRPIFIENCNFGSNLKISHFGPKMGIWFIDYCDEKIGDKKLRFMGIEKWYLYTKKKNKMKPTGISR